MSGDVAGSKYSVISKKRTYSKTELGQKVRQKNVSLRFSNRRLSLPFISKTNSVKYVVFETLYQHTLCAIASDEGKGITVHDHIKGNEQLLHFPTKNEIKGIAFIKGPSPSESPVP